MFLSMAVTLFKQFSLLILITLLLTIAATVMYYFYLDFKQDYEEYEAEGECISKLISTGVERKDISASNGVCSVKKRA